MNKDSNIPNFGDSLKKNPFSVPDGYFDSLPSRIQEKCVKPVPKRSWVKTLIPQLGFVVGFVVLVLIAKGFFGIVGQTPENPQANVAQVTDTTMYYDENGEQFYADEDIAIDDAIISYLVDNNISDIDIVQE
ncbi:MAG: hypothetical protein LBG19_06770 [Prevotellaceae bacterium]|jgi:hypothetical protein|nr:hypothetical protein [Prevotellaceae bacterium]